MGTATWLGFEPEEIARKGRCPICRKRDVILGVVKVSGEVDGRTDTWQETACSSECATRFVTE